MNNNSIISIITKKPYIYVWWKGKEICYRGHSVFIAIIKALLK